MTFLAMGGYWPFVWPAFALAAAVLGALWLASWRSQRAFEAAFKGMPDARRRPGAAP